MQSNIWSTAHIPRGEEDRQREMGEGKKTKESWKMVTVLVKGTLIKQLVPCGCDKYSDNERTDYGIKSNQQKQR